MPAWLVAAWKVLNEAVVRFIEDEALSRGAAIAFYAVTALAPVLLIVVAIAGLAFGPEASHLALSAQISGLMGSQAADLFEATLQSAGQQKQGVWAAAIGIVILLITASGVFGEMQNTLNKIWRIEPKSTALKGIIRARAVSLGLVAALGFVLIVSLVASTAITALGGWINQRLPFGEFVLSIINAFVSFVLISVLFAAIYKVLPDRALKWRDVLLGAIVTALLFTVGKSLIGWYIGTSNIASSYGAGGAMMVVLLWVYYSAEIFLFGAELTRAYTARTRGTPPRA